MKIIEVIVKGIYEMIGVWKYAVFIYDTGSFRFVLLRWKYTFPATSSQICFVETRNHAKVELVKSLLKKIQIHKLKRKDNFFDRTVFNVFYGSLFIGL